MLELICGEEIQNFYFMRKITADLFTESQKG